MLPIVIAMLILICGPSDGTMPGRESVFSEWAIPRTGFAPVEYRKVEAPVDPIPRMPTPRGTDDPAVVWLNEPLPSAHLPAPPTGCTTIGGALYMLCPKAVVPSIDPSLVKQ
jgi:hypothetical protein